MDKLIENDSNLFTMQGIPSKSFTIKPHPPNLSNNLRGWTLVDLSGNMFERRTSTIIERSWALLKESAEPVVRYLVSH